MKQPSMKHWMSLGLLIAMTSVGPAQTTATRGTPTITGFAPNPVSGFNAQPVTGLTPQPFRGLSSPAPLSPSVTNFTTGPISPLATPIAGIETNGQVFEPVVPPLPVAPSTPTNLVTNAVGTPLF